MENTVKERLIIFIKHKKLSQKRFEIICGMSNGYVNSIRKGLGADKLQSIVRNFPDLNREWLLYGEGTMLNPPTHTVTQTNYNGNNNYIYGSKNVQDVESHYTPAKSQQAAPIVPVRLTNAPGTDVLEAMEHSTESFEFAPFTAHGISIRLWQRIMDNAMTPRYDVGDLIALCPYEQGHERPIPGKAYVIDTRSNGMILRLLFPCPEGYIARSINAEDFPEFIIEREDITRIYRIIMTVRL